MVVPVFPLAPFFFFASGAFFLGLFGSKSLFEGF